MTRPTTIRAITEIPANTPKPIGRTESFVPGSWNDAAGLDDAVSAADEAEVGLFEASPTAVPVAVAVALAAAGLPDETAVAATVEKPYTRDSLV